MCPPGPGLNDIGIDDALREVDLDIAIGGGLTTGRIVSFSLGSRSFEYGGACQLGIRVPR